MNEKEILEIAHSVGMGKDDYSEHPDLYQGSDDELLAFAREVERRSVEACKQVCPDPTSVRGSSGAYSNGYIQAINDYHKAISALLTEPSKDDDCCKTCKGSSEVGPRR